MAQEVDNLRNKETEVAQQHKQQVIAELALTGNMKGLSPADKVFYYREFCNHLGLDPITQPFSIIEFKGKQVLYAGKGCANQLNNKYNISHTIIERKKEDTIFMVTARATTPNGRSTESIGAVSILTNDGKELVGESFSNAIMKAETKAKRRATLDLVGLGMPDVSEASSIQDAEFYAINPETGEQVQEMPFYQLQYSSKGELLKVLQKCTDVKQVANLYNYNKHITEPEGNADATLVQAFKVRREELNSPKEQQVQDAEVVEEEKENKNTEESDFKL